MGNQSLFKALVGLIFIQLVFIPQGVAELIFDNRINSNTKKIIIGDINRISKMGIQNIPNESLFSKTFGTEGDANTIKYLSKRIHFVVPSYVKYTEFLNLKTQRLNSNIEEVATNISLNLFITKLINLPNQLFFTINGNSYSINSIRIGVLGVSPAYNKPNSNQVERISTLIHEARHSDCIKPFNQSELSTIAAGGKTNNYNCGFLHTICPSGHPYEGYPACDNNLWGSYSVESIYMAALISENTCPNCSETERSVAKMIVLDDLSRVLNWKKLNSGEYGPPKIK